MGLLSWGVDLQPCKTMTDTLAPVERGHGRHAVQVANVCSYKLGLKY